MCQARLLTYFHAINFNWMFRDTLQNCLQPIKMFLCILVICIEISISVLSRAIFVTLSLIYPACALLKSIRQKHLIGFLKWTNYWIILACWEMCTNVFLCWLPYYYGWKILGILWLWRGQYSHLWKIYIPISANAFWFSDPKNKRTISGLHKGKNVIGNEK